MRWIKFVILPVFLLLIYGMVAFVAGWHVHETLPPKATLIAAPLVYVPALSVSDPAQHRQAIVSAVFGDQLPSHLPMLEGTRFIIHVGDFVSIAYLHEAVSPNGAAMILHVGHEGDNQDYYREAIARLNEAGYTVVLMNMPLIGENTAPSEYQYHGDMATLEHPLRYFIEPVIVVINHLTQGYDHLYMMGLSGGGWTTTLAAAIDTRIEASYPIAGSVPMALRYLPKDMGDFEQIVPEFYGPVTSYENLYLLGAYQRRQIQILNDKDSCCYAYNDHAQAIRFYEQTIQHHLEDDGIFRVWVDEGQTAHVISEQTLDYILADLSR